MHLKFKHSKITFNLKTKAEDGFNLFFAFNSQVKDVFHEISGGAGKYLADDLTAAGNLVLYANNILVSLGEEDKFNLAVHAKLAYTVARAIAGRKIDELNLHFNPLVAEKLNLSLGEVVEKFILDFSHGLYYFDDFKSEKAKLSLEKVHVISASKITGNLANALALAEGLFIVRDLANNPANVATPTYIAKVAKELEKINKQVSVSVLDEKEILELGMNAFLGVAKGSKEEPRFIQLEYRAGKKNSKPLVLVGKGVTFDSGGISLKPGANMDDMKYDMCGAATVIGVFAAVAKLALPVNLIVLVPACENMPSGRAQKPGDIVTTMSGKTVEILNTDAEGRLLLCDALHYAKRFNPEWVIDVATLTGACIIALGNAASGLYVNDEVLCQAIEVASLTSSEKIWRMPLFEEYDEAIRGTHGDLLNIGGWGGKGGSATAAAFLKQFTDYKWAHLDIAGVANGPEWKGASGRPYKLLIELIRNTIV